MSPKDYSDYGLAQELLRLRTHAPELMAEAAKRLAALAQPAPVQAGAQQAVAEIVTFGGGGSLKEVSWHKGKMPPVGTKLYAAPTQAGAGDAKGGTA